MSENGERWIAEFLSEIEGKVCSLLQTVSPFVNRLTLLKKYRSRLVCWKKGGRAMIDEMTAMTNELFVAKWILSQDACMELTYEPKGAVKSGATIDFCAKCSDGQVYYLDVKTIQPQDKDDWDKFVRHSQLFPANVKMILNKNGLGGEIWHARFTSRSAMLLYAKEFEKKIQNYASADKTCFIMTFCGNGFDWHEDALEDFADFYRTGRHNPDDCFSGMENCHMSSEDMKFIKNINSFMYLERPNTEVDIGRVCCPVEGPWLGNRWRST